jgi:SAM-dependent methyltransferase
VSAIPHEAAEGFQRGAADYERGRPGYPAAAVQWLARELGIGAGCVVVDLAAGTGKLTRALTGLGAELVAVEPVAGMREQLKRAVPGVQVREGTAEHLPLEDGSVDAVLVAQAFHWFDIPAAAAEIHRVLTPSGGLGVIRNEWDESVDWVVDMRALIARHAGEPPHRHGRRWRSALEETRLFTDLRDEVFRHPVEVDLETLRARVASLSYVAMMEADRRSRLLDAVCDLVRERGLVAAGGRLVTPYRTHVTSCRRRAS